MALPKERSWQDPLTEGVALTEFRAESSQRVEIRHRTLRRIYRLQSYGILICLPAGTTPAAL